MTDDQKIIAELKRDFLAMKIDYETQFRKRVQAEAQSKYYKELAEAILARSVNVIDGINKKVNRSFENIDKKINALADQDFNKESVKKLINDCRPVVVQGNDAAKRVHP